jgi:hypothetical protein
MDSTGLAAMILQFVPITVIGWLWLIPVYKTCRKRGVSPWLWMVLVAVPIVSMIALPVFWITTIMNILDRLNASDEHKEAFS